MVLDNGPLPDPLALLMVALASHAAPNGWCWPGHETLARRTRKTPRQVIRNLKALACAGWLTIHPRAAGEGKKQTAYTLNMARLSEIRSDAQMSHDIQLSHGIGKPNDLAATYGIRSDAQMSHDPRSDIQGGCEVTSEAISCDISASSNKRNQRTKEPTLADAFEREVVYDEYAQAPPTKAKRPQPVKPKGDDDAEVDAIWAEYPRKVDAKYAKRSIRVALALLRAGHCEDGQGNYLPKLQGSEATAYLLGQTREFAKSPQGKGDPDAPNCTQGATWFNKRRFAQPGTWAAFSRVSRASQTRTAGVPRSIAEKMAEQRSGTR